MSPPESSDDEEAKQRTLRLRHLAKARQEKKKKQNATVSSCNMFDFVMY